MSKSILAVLLFGLANVHAWVTVARAPLTLTIAVSSRPGLLSVESRTSMALSATTPPFDQTENPRVSVLRRSYEAYEHLCATKPFITKSITASIIVAIGNIISQSLQATLRVQRLHLNLSQVGAFALTGLLYIGPFYHVWYEQLWRLGDWMEARYGCSKAQQTLAQNFADQSLGVAVFFPIYFFVYEVFEALMSWRAPLLTTTYRKCIHTVMSIVIANWKVWPLINYLNFRAVPQSLRVLVMNGASVLWNAFFCAMMA